ncbi:hypothetical protein [Micromonospora haikouensis]|uniref:hypothetical protein n=1 Tax=Micromonospora haikouensis TaxID=686309 RepID=UPI003D924798
MRERPHDGPLPTAYPMPDGRPPQPDGDRVPCPSRPDARAPISRRQYAYGIAIAVVVLVLLVLGILG